MVQGQTIIEYDPKSKTAQAITGIWKRLADRLEL